MRPPEPVLICALSGRALAQAARAAGYAPIVLDAFGDLDTQEVAEAWQRIPVTRRWMLRRRPLLAAAARLAPPPIPIVWGSGFERAPALLHELSTGRELLGNARRMVHAVKDPRGFASALRELDLPHPELRLSQPRPVSGWLRKRVGGAGGGHVRAAGRHAPRGRGWYWQRRARGEPHSALVVGNGDEARALAFGRQLLAPDAARPFRFGGTLAPAGLSALASRRAETAAAAIAGRYRVRGLASVDMLVDGDDIVVLEMNPRPGASLDAYRDAFATDLFRIHVAACRGGPLPTRAAPVGFGGSLIVHARRAAMVPPAFPWPEWTADRSPAGTRMVAGGPICTVRARGDEPTSVERQLRIRAASMLDAFSSP